MRGSLVVRCRADVWWLIGCNLTYISGEGSGEGRSLCCGWLVVCGEGGSLVARCCADV